jgi:predicted transcriptional regulator
MGSSTSSFRIPDDLKARLERTARRLNKGKNWVINRALKEYLERQNQGWLRAEAVRQSVLAGKKKWKDEKLWGQALAEAWDDR